MRKISKALAIGAVTLALGGAGVAVAQGVGPGDGPGGFGPPGFMHGRGGPGMMHGWGGGERGARVEHLKAELGIRPEQQPAWDAYVKAVRESAEQMRAIHESMDFDKLQTMPWKDVQAYMAGVHDKRAAAYRNVEAAATKLIASLDDGQKTKALLPLLVHTGGRGMMGHHAGMWGGGPDGRP